jgi:membrane protein implicated in regulation of membrane protease activity
MSRITALSLPAGAGAVISGIYKFAQSVPPWGWAILGGCFVIMAVLGAWLYNESMKRANERTKMVGAAAADKDKNNLRLI